MNSFCTQPRLTTPINQQPHSNNHTKMTASMPFNYWANNIVAGFNTSYRHFTSCLTSYSHCIVTHHGFDKNTASCFRKLLTSSVIRGLSAPSFVQIRRHCSHSADKKREICQVHPSVYMRLRDIPADKLPYFFCSIRLVSTKRG